MEVLELSYTIIPIVIYHGFKIALIENTDLSNAKMRDRIPVGETIGIMEQLSDEAIFING